MWPSEPRDFTPWLAANLDYLDVLELGPLVAVEVEAPLPDSDRALDILAETADGRVVAIENQFGRADHDHLTRGLAYAVGFKAAALVVIAEEHAPEFRAIAEYLNHAAESVGLEDGGVGVYLVQLAVERLEDWHMPRLTVVERPNEWLSDAGEGTKAGRITSDEEFLARATDGSEREALRTIITGWLARPDATRTFSTQAVALRVPKPGGSGTVAALTLFPDAVWINAGYLTDAATAAGAPADAVTHMVQECWPTATRGEAGYYWRAVNPSPADAERFADRLWELWSTLDT